MNTSILIKMNKRNIFIVIIGISVLLFGINSPKKIIKDIQKRFPENANMKIKFTQVFFWSMSETSDTLSGIFFLNSENHYRILTPVQEILFDGENIWSYNYYNKQIIIDLKREDEIFDLNFLRENWNERYLAIKIKSEDKDQIILKLTPKYEETDIVSIKMIIEKNSWKILSFQQEDINKNLITIFIEEMESNPVDTVQYETIESDSAEIIDLR